MTYFRTDSCSDGLVISAVNQLLTNGPFVSWEPKHLPHILTCIQSHFLPPQGHFFAQVYLFKGRLSSQLLRWENLKMSWPDDPERHLTEEMREEARDRERLPSHTENCPQSWEFILFHLLFREISQLHWDNSKEWDRGANFVSSYH